MIFRYPALLLALVPLCYTDLTAALTAPNNALLNFEKPSSSSDYFTMWRKGKQAEIEWSISGDLNPGQVNIPVNISLVNEDVHWPLATVTVKDAKSSFKTTVNVPHKIEDGEFTIRVDGLSPLASWYSSTLLVVQ